MAPVIFLGIHFRRRQLLYLLGDVLIALVAVYLGHALRLRWTGYDMGLLHILDVSTGASFFFVLTHVLLLYIADGYNAEYDYRKPRQVLRVWMAVVAAFVLQMAIFYAFPNWRWGRGIAGLGTLSFGVLLTMWRAFVCQMRPARPGRSRTVIVGAGRAGTAMADVLLQQEDYGVLYDLVGFVDDKVKLSPTGLPILGTGPTLAALASEHRVDMIIVAIRGGMSRELTEKLLECKAEGVRIVDMPAMYKRLTGKVPILHMADTWIIFGPGFSGEIPIYRAIVRLADVAISVVGLIGSLPVILAAGVLVKLDSKGPMFYSQERLGKNERPFTIHKMRTMTTDAEAKTGAVWSQGAADPRVTRVGRFLRRSRIDELPQFWNVLKGEMSMVGPRPERQHFVDQLKKGIPFYSLRFAVKPGVTGWAQVMYRYGASEEDAAEKLQYELYAIQEMSPFLYLLIILKTVQTVLLRPGS